MPELKDLLRQLITSTLTEVNLSEINDWKTLVKMWKKADTDDFMGTLYIEERMKEVLSGFTDWDTLIALWDDAECVIDSLIEKRLSEVLPSILPGIGDGDILIQMWGDSPPTILIEQLIEARLAEVIDTITLDDVPQWFINRVAAPISIPNSISKSFVSKARALLAHL